MARLFRRARDGSLRAELPLHVVEILRQLVDELGQMLAAPAAGAVTDRLFPRAYLDPTEENAEQDWQGLVHDDLVQTRVEAVRGVLDDIAAASERKNNAVIVLRGDEADVRWLTVLNDLRITLGVMLDVTEEEPLEDLAADDPRAPMADIYHLLTALQGELVDVLLADLPEAGTADEPTY